MSNGRTTRNSRMSLPRCLNISRQYIRKTHLNTSILLHFIISSMNSWKTSMKMYCLTSAPDLRTV